MSERCNSLFANEGEGYFYCSQPEGHIGVHASSDGPASNMNERGEEVETPDAPGRELGRH